MYIEKIKFERTGGFAGMRIAAEIKMDDLPDDQKHEIIELMDEADFDELPEKLSGKMPVPDEFVYSIVVNSREKEYQVIAGESALPNDLQPLIEILESIAKRQMRKKED
ncbi:MAG TPA: protealysin inhibitor emfourin [Anaerolineales bacterium]|nr:protealysin inhibitor emfourin [Anaerolineales bacterium]